MFDESLWLSVWGPFGVFFGSYLLLFVGETFLFPGSRWGGFLMMLVALLGYGYAWYVKRDRLKIPKKTKLWPAWALLGLCFLMAILARTMHFFLLQRLSGLLLGGPKALEGGPLWASEVTWFVLRPAVWTLLVQGLMMPRFMARYGRLPAIYQGWVTGLLLHLHPFPAFTSVFSEGFYSLVYMNTGSLGFVYVCRVTTLLIANGLSALDQDLFQDPLYQLLFMTLGLVYLLAYGLSPQKKESKPSGITLDEESLDLIQQLGGKKPRS